MKKTTSNLILLNAIFCSAIVLSNVISPRLIDTHIPWFGGIVVPGAFICYAFSFLATDIIGEIFGKKEANRAVWRGFVTQLLATAFILLTQYLPSPVFDAEHYNAYRSLLGMNWVFVAGSLTGFCISQSWDVYIFHKIREKFNGNPKHRWIWNNASTVTSQLFDTAIYITIAFGLGIGYLRSGSPAYNPQLFWGMLVGQYLVKVAVAIIDTPFFYFFTRNADKREENVVNGEYIKPAKASK